MVRKIVRNLKKIELLSIDSEAIQYIQMQMHIENYTRESDQVIEKTYEFTRKSNCRMFTPLFKVTKGICTDSLGIYCAKISGVPEAIIQRANEVC